MKTFADFYAKGEYSNALTELEKNRDSISKGLWHYNVGTIKAKESKFSEARYHLIQAGRDGYSETGLSQNLEIVERELELTKLEKPLGVSDYAVKFSIWAQTGFFTTVALVVLVAGLFLMRKSKSLLSLTILLLLSSLPMGIQFWVRSWTEVVAIESLDLREGPSVIFGSRGEISPGVLLVVKKNGDWNEVTYPSRFRGWIKNTGIKELE